MSNTRTATSWLFDMALEGLISWESIASECLAYMPESEVKEVAETFGFDDEESNND